MWQKLLADFWKAGGKFTPMFRQYVAQDRDKRYCREPSDFTIYQPISHYEVRVKEKEVASREEKIRDLLSRGDDRKIRYFIHFGGVLDKGIEMDKENVN
jgi:ribosomal protein S16